MFELKLNQKKNAVLSMPQGRFDETEAEQYNQRYAACVDQLQPGFTLVVDLKAFIPPEESVRLLMKKGTEYAVKKGLTRVIRIVDDNVGSAVGSIQLNRAARELGYRVDIVHSMEEAEQLLA